MPDFLLELRSEEIPARMQAKAREDLARMFAEEIAKSGLSAEAIETFATPRRLALIARGLPSQTEAVREERKGPRVNAPEQAIAGFLRSTGVTREQLQERDGVFLATFERPGRATAGVLAEVIPAIVRVFPWPKSMRWGAASVSTESPRWVRPLQGIVALFGDAIVRFEIAGVASGAATLGHRFHHPGEITIGNADDYAEKLRMCHVIVHLSERSRVIRDGAARAAQVAGLTLVEDEALVAENAGLTEWPVPLLGRFDAAYLDVPPEVIRLTMRTNQKYFACTGADGALADAFVCTANIDAIDGGVAVVAGNERVLAARLADAKFFWEQDLKVPLADQAAKLGGIVFHEKLGTVADKVDRVAKLARWLVEEGIIQYSPLYGGEGPGEGHLATLAETAARLCKADLVTGLVGEFPELQGVIGGHLAHTQGLNSQIAEAIRDHYKPVGHGDDVPTAPLTVAVSLADKLDTIMGFYYWGEMPTGSKDPFALRRAAIGILRLILINHLRVRLQLLFHIGFQLVQESMRRLPAQSDGIPGNAAASAVLLVIDRLKVQQREAGIRHDLIDAVFALGEEDDLVRLLARVEALQAFVGTADGANLLSGYKRAANILKKESPLPGKEGSELGVAVGEGKAEESALRSLLTPGPSSLPGREENRLSYTPDPEETALADALDSAEPLATAAIGHEDFEGAMQALSGLRAPIDAFFDKVTVNDSDPSKRASRLALLARVRDAVHSVADFSRIES